MKIRVSPFMYLFVLIMIALGYLEQFFMLVLFISLHEIAHIVAAWLIARECRVKSWYISPLGEVAVISGLEMLPPIKRVVIALAGPVLNGLIALLFYGAGFWENAMVFNLVIAVVNLLPIFPLDGARVFQMFLGNIIGIINANRVIFIIGRTFAVILFALGIVQVILFPPNVSMIALALFLLLGERSQRAQKALDAYNYLFDCCKRNRTLREKHIKAVENDNIIIIYKRLGYSHNLVIHTETRILTEHDIIMYIMENGLTGKLINI